MARLMRDENGQDPVDYGLLIAGIACLVLIGSNVLGSRMSSLPGGIADRLTTAP